MKKTLTGLLTCLLLFFFQQSQAQDMHFSQFYHAPLNLNPALTGSFNGNIRAVANYKNQWNSISKPYRTIAASFDMGFLKAKWDNGYLAGGLNFFSDKAGDAELGWNQINLSAASHVYLSESQSLSAGLQASFAQRNINYSNLKWGSQYDGTAYNPSIDPNDPVISSTNMSYADFGAGLQWNYGKGERYATANDEFNLNIGASMFHLTKPELSFYGTSEDEMPYKFILHGGSFIGIPNTNVGIVPALMYARQGPFQEILAGTRIRYKLKEESQYTDFVKGAAFSVGGHYRVGDAAIVSTYLEFGSFALGVSYDINVSKLKTASNGRGGVEISLRYINPNPFKQQEATAPRL